MPKVSLTINDFSGGLNTDVSPRDLEGNQLEVCTNLDPSSVGRLKMASQFKDADTDIQGGNNDFTSAAHATPGYGLFVFSNDNEVSAFTDATCDTTDTDATVTMDSTANLLVGMTVAGTGIVSGSYVASITNATTFELSVAATETASDRTLAFS